MRKLFNKPWFVALLALAAVFFVAYSLWPERTSGLIAAVADSVDVGDGTSTAESGAPSGRRSLQDALKELTPASPVRDPFLSRITVTQTTANLEKVAEPDLTESVAVSAVWIQGGATFGLVNGHIYRVGDHIGRLTLESADRNGIWFRHWKGRNFVAIGAAFTLTTPARQAAELSLSSES